MEVVWINFAPNIVSLIIWAGKQIRTWVLRPSRSMTSAPLRDIFRKPIRILNFRSTIDDAAAWAGAWMLFFNFTFRQAKFIVAAIHRRSRSSSPKTGATFYIFILPHKHNSRWKNKILMHILCTFSKTLAKKLFSHSSWGCAWVTALWHGSGFALRTIQTGFEWSSILKCRTD